ncbi:MAG: glycoside hydrolase family 1 protein [Lactobacillus sp.]|nr:glycoside hydrolase family 1 protein [Lactobacillus sp.]MCI2033017.1 glycoside hydrolase family 1 protein [Lactobacillus sp.]
MSEPLPKTFLWGNSTSSMQTEGGVTEGGKGQSVYDVRPATDTTSDWRVAIDEYHRFEEDFDWMQQAGMTCYRFQISWSRVCPTGDGEFNEAGLAFYERQIAALLARGITPMICLYHFDMPLSLAKRYNGFMSRHVVDAFVRFAKVVIARFAAKVPYWLTFNEQNLYFTSGAFDIAGYLKGPRSLQDLYTINHHVMVAHARVANYLHATTTAQIGGMLAYEECYPATSNPRDAWYARQIDEFLNHNLLEMFVHGHYSSAVLQHAKQWQLTIDITPEDLAEFSQLRSDFFAFSYYRSHLIDSSRVPVNTPVNDYLDYGMVANPYTQANEWGWNIDPLGFRDILTTVYSRYHLPMFPIENGLGIREESTGDTEVQDDYRIAYHRAHIQALKDAVTQDGVDVLGYLGWGLIDIPSSSGNMDKRYGMVYVNRTNHDLRDLRRVPKKSFAWFQQVIASNGARLD